MLPSSPMHLHVLAVDDEEYVLEMLEHLLSYLGFRVTTASTGNEALRKFFRQSYAFDLIVTDYSMPDMNGLDFRSVISIERYFEPNSIGVFPGPIIILSQTMLVQ